MTLSAEQRNSLAIATLRYEKDLEEALPWLEKRGITEAIARSRRLGLVKNPIKGDGPFVGRLSIPYITDAGPVSMNFRCILDHDCKAIDKHSKYRKPKGIETRLYGVQDYFNKGLAIHITEGELDTIILSRVVGLPSIGLPGSANWSDHYKYVFKDFDDMYMWCDGDSAGNAMFNKFAKEFGRRIKLVPLPEGEDVNSLYLKRGAEYMRSLVPQ